MFVFPVVSFATASELSFAEYDTFTFCPWFSIIQSLLNFTESLRAFSSKATVYLEAATATPPTVTVTPLAGCPVVN